MSHHTLYVSSKTIFFLIKCEQNHGHIGKKKPNNCLFDISGAWISPNIFIYTNIFCGHRILLPLASHSLLKNPSETGRHNYLHVNKQRQVYKHWWDTFLTFVSSFDSQMPQGHWYNLLISWGFLQIYSSPHKDWDSVKHLLIFTYWNNVPSTPTARTAKWCLEINLWSYVYSAFFYLEHQ